MANAAKDFCSFLVRSGEMRQEEVPGDASKPGAGGDGGQGQGGPAPGAAGMALGLATKTNMFGEGFGPRSMGQAYQMRGQ